MSTEIYFISGSAPAWRVLMMAEVKNIDYQPIVLETSKKQQKEAWFLNLNPRGQIPLLKHNDVIISESLAIMHYLENAFPQNPLFGTNAIQTAAIEQSVYEILSYVDKPIADFVQPVFRNKIDQFRDSLDALADKILSELSLLNKRLSSHNNFLVGEFSVADIVLTPTLQRLYRGVSKAPELADSVGLGDLAGMFPNLHRWRLEIESMSAFTASFPPHWR